MSLNSLDQIRIRGTHFPFDAESLRGQNFPNTVSRGARTKLYDEFTGNISSHNTFRLNTAASGGCARRTCCKRSDRGQ